MENGSTKLHPVSTRWPSTPLPACLTYRSRTGTRVPVVLWQRRSLPKHSDSQQSFSCGRLAVCAKVFQSITNPFACGFVWCSFLSQESFSVVGVQVRCYYESQHANILCRSRSVCSFCVCLCSSNQEKREFLWMIDEWTHICVFVLRTKFWRTILFPTTNELRAAQTLKPRAILYNRALTSE